MLLSMNTEILPKVRFIGYASYSSPWIHFKRIINEYIIYIIKKGEMYIEEGNREYVLKKGDFLILQPNIEHKGYKKSCCDYYYVHFSHSQIEVVNDEDMHPVTSKILSNRKKSLTSDCLSEKDPSDPTCYIPKYYNLKNEEQFIVSLKEAIGDFYNRYENYKKLISCRILDMLIRICREYATTEIENKEQHVSKSYAKVSSIIQFLNTSYHKKVTSSYIEEMFESNYDYLNRTFHRLTGYTIMNYLSMIRINKAKELIEVTPLKFSEIAYLIGINDPYYFSKLFKKYTGMTPSQYTNKAKPTVIPLS